MASASTPQGPDEMTSLTLLADALEQAEVDRLRILMQRRLRVREARANGWPVTSIAGALRISRQQAHTLLTD